MSNNTQEKKKTFTDTTDTRSLEKLLILHNDDHNSFDHVISSLIAICEHTEHQAIQCAMIAHHNGKCDVYKGPVDIITPMKKKLQLRGLIVSIE